MKAKYNISIKEEHSMNDSLSVGNSYTYKQMCECLNEPYKGGTAKQAHIYQTNLSAVFPDQGRYQVYRIGEIPDSKAQRKAKNYFKFQSTVFQNSGIVSTKSPNNLLWFQH